MLGLFGNKKEPKKEVAESVSQKQDLPVSPKQDSAARIAGRKLQGVVVSNKMKKTAVVAVSHSKKHSKYKKYFTLTKRFTAHDEINEFKIGDKVNIEETRPLSKEKWWRVIGKL